MPGQAWHDITDLSAHAVDADIRLADIAACAAVIFITEKIGFATVKLIVVAVTKVALAFAVSADAIGAGICVVVFAHAVVAAVGKVVVWPAMIAIRA